MPNLKMPIPLNGSTGQVLKFGVNGCYWDDEAGGGGGGTPSAQWSNSAGLTTGNNFAVVTTWTQDVTNGSHGITEALGVFTFANAGTYALTCQFLANTTANNRVQLDIDVERQVGGAGWTTFKKGRQYAIRNNTQADGDVAISFWQFDVSSAQASAGFELRLQYKDDGQVATSAVGDTYIGWVKLG